MKGRRASICNDIMNEFEYLIRDPSVPADEVELSRNAFIITIASYPPKEVNKVRRKMMIETRYVNGVWKWKMNKEVVEILRGKMGVELPKRRIQHEKD